MDRGTLVIRHSNKGVTFTMFDPGKRDEAETMGADLFNKGEDPFVCCNLQELKEAEPTLRKLMALALEMLAEKGTTPQEFDARARLEHAIEEQVLGPMNARALELADAIAAAFNAEPEGTGTKIPIEPTDWTIIVAALRKQL